MQSRLQLGVVRSRLLLDDVTLSLRSRHANTLTLLSDATARAAANPALEMESSKSAGPDAAPATKMPGRDVATGSKPEAPPASMKPYLFCWMPISCATARVPALGSMPTESTTKSIVDRK